MLQLDPQERISIETAKENAFVRLDSVPYLDANGLCRDGSLLRDIHWYISISGRGDGETPASAFEDDSTEDVFMAHPFRFVR